MCLVVVFNYRRHTLPLHDIYQQRVRTHDEEGNDMLQDTPKTGNHWREDHVRCHNDTLVHVGQARTELIQKIVRSILDDLISYQKDLQQT